MQHDNFPTCSCINSLQKSVVCVLDKQTSTPAFQSFGSANETVAGTQDYCYFKCLCDDNDEF